MVLSQDKGRPQWKWDCRRPPLCRPAVHGDTIFLDCKIKLSPTGCNQFYATIDGRNYIYLYENSVIDSLMDAVTGKKFSLLS